MAMARNPRIDRNWRDQWSRSERLTDFALVLARVQWDFFCTPTFKGSVPRPSIVALTAACFALQSYAQGVSYAPLYLFTNGDGSISPLQDGQSLEVGQSYEMEAVPDSGFVFSSWQPVNVFAITQTNYDGFGNPILPPITSVVPSTVPQYTYQPVLDFTMQPLMLVTPADSNPNITESFGWQANFVPIPEPSNLTLVVFSLTLIMLVWYGRFRRDRPCCLTPRWSQRPLPLQFSVEL
jgi:hypothetical protein